MESEFRHQTKAITRYKDSSIFALFHEPGCGKSLTTIRIMEGHYKAGRINLAIIVVPKSMILTWALFELPKWSTVPFEVHAWRGMNGSEEQRNYLNWTAIHDKLRYLIVNHDAIPSGKFTGIFKHFIKLMPKYGVAVDEATAIKTPNTDRTKAIIAFGRKAAVRGILTGTPVVQGPLDLYSQCDFLKPGLLEESSFYSFKTRYAILKRMKFGKRSFDQIVGYRDTDHLKTLLDKFGDFVTLQEATGMPLRPPPIPVYVEMTPVQHKAYKELIETAITYIQGHEITVLNAMSMMTRLHQILCGQIKLPDGTYASIENNRINALKELFDSANGQVLIWNTYVNSGKDILKALGKEAVLLSSELNTVEREAVINEFRHGKKGIILNPSNAAHGLTFNEAAYSIYFSNSHNYEHRVQSLGRNWRIGQTKRVITWDLWIRSVVEDSIMANLNDKMTLSDKFKGNGVKAVMLDILERARLD